MTKRLFDLLSVTALILVIFIIAKAIDRATSKKIAEIIGLMQIM